jgi:hypothetical protein
MSPSTTRVTDSPWFWIVLFLCGGLIILTIAAPRIESRQRRLDMQFRARQAAGQTVLHDSHELPSEESPPASAPTLVPVRPLMIGLVIAMIGAAFMLWLTTTRSAHHDDGSGS